MNAHAFNFTPLSQQSGNSSFSEDFPCICLNWQGIRGINNQIKKIRIVSANHLEEKAAETHEETDENDENTVHTPFIKGHRPWYAKCHVIHPNFLLINLKEWQDFRMHWLYIWMKIIMRNALLKGKIRLRRKLQLNRLDLLCLLPRGMKCVNRITSFSSTVLSVVQCNAAAR